MSLLGHNPPFTCTVGQAFRLRHCSGTGHRIITAERSLIGRPQVKSRVATINILSAFHYCICSMPDLLTYTGEPLNEFATSVIDALEAEGFFVKTTEQGPKPNERTALPSCRLIAPVRFPSSQTSSASYTIQASLRDLTN